MLRHLIFYSLCLSVCMSVCMYMCTSAPSVFAYKSWRDGWILVVLTYIIDIDETLKLTRGQVHKFKGHGHIGVYVKNSLGYNSWTFGLILMIFLWSVMLRVKAHAANNKTSRSIIILWQARARLIFTRRKCPCFVL